MKLLCVFPPGPRDEEPVAVPGDWEVILVNRLDQLSDDDIAGADAMIVSHHNPIDRQAMERLRGLKLIQQIGVGVDTIDLAAARELGIPVANVSKANDATVAEYVIMAMVYVMRRIPEAIELAREGIAVQPAMIARGSFELRGRTLGLVGFGAIARELATRALAMGMSLVSHDIAELSDDERRLGVRRLSLDELLARSDVVSIHVPLTDDTRHLIGPAQLARMKPDAYLINASRGGIVDEAALAAALTEKRLAGAAVDVYEVEPMRGDNPLIGAPNVLLTPHIAGATTDSVAYMSRKAFENCGRIAAGLEPVDRVC